jgi:hypothetical protein
MSANSRDRTAVQALREFGYTEQADALEEWSASRPDPTISAVLRDDAPAPAPDAEPELLTRAELEALTHERHVELEQKHPGLIASSLAAL